MGATIWKRLLWKEYRESIWVLAAGIALALAMIVVHKYDFVFPCIGLISVLLTLWTAERVRYKGVGGAGTRGLLPISAPLRLTFTYLVPSIVPILVGMGVGVGLHRFPAQFECTDLVLIPAVALFMLANFFLCTTITTIYSIVPALIVGVLFLFTFTTQSVVEHMGLFCLIIGVSTWLSLLWDAMAGKQWYTPVRVLTPVVFALVVIAPLASRSGIKLEMPAFHRYYNGYWYPQGVPVDGLSVQRMKDSTLIFQDSRRGIVRETNVPTWARPLGIVQRAQVFLGAEGREDQSYHIYSWHIDDNKPLGRSLGGSNQPPEVATFRLGSYQLQQLLYFNASSDGHYAVCVFPSHIGCGGDIWIADLQRHHVDLVLADVGAPSDWQTMSWDSLTACWSAKTCDISGRDLAFSIDLHTMRGSIASSALEGRTAQ